MTYNDSKTDTDVGENIDICHFCDRTFATSALYVIEKNYEVIEVYCFDCLETFVKINPVKRSKPLSSFKTLEKYRDEMPPF